MHFMIKEINKKKSMLTIQKIRTKKKILKRPIKADQKMVNRTMFDLT